MYVVDRRGRKEGAFIFSGEDVVSRHIKRNLQCGAEISLPFFSHLALIFPDFFSAIKSFLCSRRALFASEVVRFAPKRLLSLFLLL